MTLEENDKRSKELIGAKEKEIDDLLNEVNNYKLSIKDFEKKISENEGSMFNLKDYMKKILIVFLNGSLHIKKLYYCFIILLHVVNYLK